jgi:hypothetical protein
MSDGGDRRTRAQKRLDRAGRHVEGWFDRVSALNADVFAFGSKLLEGNASVGSLVSDLFALEQATCEVSFVCGPGPDPSGGGSIVPVGVPLVVFDEESEASVPLHFTPPGFDPAMADQVVPPQDPLVATPPGPPAIPAENIMVRVDTTGIWVTLVDLQALAVSSTSAVAPGTYAGAIKVFDATHSVVSYPIQAICKNHLWWF